MQNSFEKPSALGPGRSELRFEAVANGHQLIHFDDDPSLLGERRHCNRETPEFRRLDSLCSESVTVR